MIKLDGNVIEIGTFELDEYWISLLFCAEEDFGWEYYLKLIKHVLGDDWNEWTNHWKLKALLIILDMICVCLLVILLILIFFVGKAEVVLFGSYKDWQPYAIYWGKCTARYLHQIRFIEILVVKILLFMYVSTRPELRIEAGTGLNIVSWLKVI